MRAMPIPTLQDERLLMADRLCNGNRTCMPPRLGLHSCQWSCVGKGQSASTCNTHRTYWSLDQPYKGTHACRRQVTTALFSQWLWIWAQVSQLWCKYGRRRRQWSEGDKSKTRRGIWVDWANVSWKKKDWDFWEEAQHSTRVALVNIGESAGAYGPDLWGRFTQNSTD